MAKEHLQQLIRIVKAGQCDNCLSPITIITHDMSITVLSPDGHPVKSDSAYNEIYGVCTNCGKRFDMVANGMSFDKKSRIRELYQEYINKNFKLNECDKKLRDENPFATIATKVARRYKNV